MAVEGFAGAAAGEDAAAAYCSAGSLADMSARRALAESILCKRY